MKFPIAIVAVAVALLMVVPSAAVFLPSDTEADDAGVQDAQDTADPADTGDGEDEYKQYTLNSPIDEKVEVGVKEWYTLQADDKGFVTFEGEGKIIVHEGGVLDLKLMGQKFKSDITDHPIIVLDKDGEYTVGSGRDPSAADEETHIYFDGELGLGPLGEPVPEKKEDGTAVATAEASYYVAEDSHLKVTDADEKVKTEVSTDKGVTNEIKMSVRAVSTPSADQKTVNTVTTVTISASLPGIHMSFSGGDLPVDVSTAAGQTNQIVYATDTTTVKSDDPKADPETTTNSKTISADIQGITVKYGEGQSVVTGSGSVKIADNAMVGDVKIAAAGTIAGTIDLKAAADSLRLDIVIEDVDTKVGNVSIVTDDVYLKANASLDKGVLTGVKGELNAKKVSVDTESIDVGAENLNLKLDVTLADGMRVPIPFIATGDEVMAPDTVKDVYKAMISDGLALENPDINTAEELASFTDGLTESIVAEELVFGEPATVIYTEGGNFMMFPAQLVMMVPTYVKDASADLELGSLSVRSEGDVDLSVSGLSLNIKITDADKKVTASLSLEDISGYISSIPEISGSLSLVLDAGYSITPAKDPDEEPTVAVKGSADLKADLNLALKNSDMGSLAFDGLVLKLDFDTANGIMASTMKFAGETIESNGLTYAFSGGNVSADASSGEFGVKSYSIESADISGVCTTGDVGKVTGRYTDIHATAEASGDDYSGGYGSVDISVSMTDGRAVNVNNSGNGTVDLKVNGGNVFFDDISDSDETLWEAIAEQTSFVLDGHTLNATSEDGSVFVPEVFVRQDGGTVTGAVGASAYFADQKSGTYVHTSGLSGCRFTADYGNNTYGLVAEHGFTLDIINKEGFDYKDGIVTLDGKTYDIKCNYGNNALEGHDLYIDGKKVEHMYVDNVDKDADHFNVNTMNMYVTLPAKDGLAPLFLVNDHKSQIGAVDSIVDGNYRIHIKLDGCDHDLKLKCIYGHDVGTDIGKIASEGYDAVLITATKELAGDDNTVTVGGVMIDLPDSVTEGQVIGIAAQQGSFKDGIGERPAYIIDCSLLDEGDSTVNMVTIYVPADDGMLSPVLLHVSENGIAEKIGSYHVTVDGKNYVAAEVDTYSYFLNDGAYEVTLHAGDNAKIADGKDVPSYTYEDGATLPTADDMTYSREGYTAEFAGWYDNKDCTGEAVTEIAKGATGPKEFWAKWNETPVTYSVTLNQGENVTIDSNDVKEYTYGVGAKLPTASDMTYSREGYTAEFAGWYDNAGLTGTAVTEISSADTGDKTFWAKWDETASTYAVTLNQGEYVTFNDGKEIASYTYGVGATLPTADDMTYSREGYTATFAGWYDNAGLTGTAVTEISSADTGDKTFWAKWNETPAPVDDGGDEDGGDVVAVLSAFSASVVIVLVAAGAAFFVVGRRY